MDLTMDIGLEPELMVAKLVKVAVPIETFTDMFVPLLVLKNHDDPTGDAVTVPEAPLVVTLLY